MEQANDVVSPPGVYPDPSGYRYLRYWDGTGWDPRPVAETWTRVWCNVIDTVLATIVWLLLASILILPIASLTRDTATADGADPVASTLSIGSLIVAFVGYFALSYRWWGRTPGMMLGKLYVVSVSCGAGKLSWGTCIARAGGLVLGYACGVMTLIWLIATASSRTKQGPHDSMANTVVLSGSQHNRPPDYRAAAVAAPGLFPVQKGPGVPEDTTPGSDSPETTDPANEMNARQPEPHPPANNSGQQAMATAPLAHDIAAPVPTNRRKRGLVIGLAVGGFVLVVGLVTSGVWVDSRIRVNEMNDLLTATEDARSAILDYRDDPRWAEIGETLTQGQEVTGRSDSYYRGLWEDFIVDTTTAAQSHVGPLQESILDLEAVSVLPWHGDIAAARDAYIEFAECWLEAASIRTSHTPATERVGTPSEGLNAAIVSTIRIAERRYQDVTIIGKPASINQRIRDLTF